MAESKSRMQRKNSKKKGHRARWGLLIIIVLFILAGGYYCKEQTDALAPSSSKMVQVEIPTGANRQQIGTILENDQLIKSKTAFSYYVRLNGNPEFKAGYYTLSPSMDLRQITTQLKKGGAAKITTTKDSLTVREGTTIDQIGDTIQAKTKFSKDDFLNLMKDQSYLQSLANRYPELLASSMESKDVRYHLEGYLFPATYNIKNVTDLKTLVNQMVATTDRQVKPYFTQIKEQKMTVQQVMTLASLVEREGVSTTDRRKIAGVFENRIAKNMPIQSDVAVMYALNTHKKSLSNKDVTVDSPYNLYQNPGYGPGPFNNPSIEAIKAVLNPVDKDKHYMYFVANIKTGKVYYSKTYDEHQAIVKKLDKTNF